MKQQTEVDALVDVQGMQTRAHAIVRELSSWLQEIQLHSCVAISQVCLAQTYTQDRISVPSLVHTYHIIILFQKCILPIYLGGQRESFLPLVRFYSPSSRSVLHVFSASYMHPFAVSLLSHH